MTILTIITNDETAVALTLWSIRIAAAYKVPLIVYMSNPSKKPALLEQSVTDLKHDIETLHSELLNSTNFAPTQISYRTHSFKQPNIEIPRIILEAEARLLILSKERSQTDSSESQILQTAFSEAPCATLALRTAAADAYTCNNILVALSGGTNSYIAAQLASKLQDASDSCHALALNVNTETLIDGQEVADLLLRKILKKAQVDPDSMSQRVITADSFAEGITQALHEKDYHLIIVGSSGIGFLRRLMFGTVPEEVLRKADGPAIAVVRSAKPLLSRAVIAIEDWLDLRIPQLNREERIRVIDNLRDSAQWNFDFMALMCLSTAIAALGLVQDSTAVVIGAMLVAPLMTPLLGAGLGLVQGNLPLMNSAGRALMFGLVTALTVSFLIGALNSDLSLTKEMAARGGPNLLDMLVGFLAGLAAAYSTARTNLSAALPGVAIAAALVPPIATIGLSLIAGEYHNALGASLLFAANVVSIVLGAALAFFASGIRWQAVKRTQAKWFLGVSAALMAISVILGSRWVAPVSSQLHNQVVALLAQELPKAKIDSIKRTKRTLKVTIQVNQPAPDTLPNQILKELTQIAPDLEKIEIYTQLSTSTANSAN